MFGVHKTALAITVVVLAATMEKSSNAAESGGQFAGPLTALSTDQQIQLAMDAAPSHISEHATVYVLGPKGYVKARSGTNGFSCLVERQYMTNAMGLASELVMRRRLEREAPERLQLRMWLYPWLTILSILAILAVLIAMFVILTGHDRHALGRDPGQDPRRHR